MCRLITCVAGEAVHHVIEETAHSEVTQVDVSLLETACASRRLHWLNEVLLPRTIGPSQLYSLVVTFLLDEQQDTKAP